MEKLVQPCRPGADSYIDTPEEQEGGSSTIDASKEIEPAPRAVAAQDPTLSSGATEIPSSPRLFRARQPPSWMKDFASSVFSRVSNFISS